MSIKYDRQVYLFICQSSLYCIVLYVRTCVHLHKQRPVKVYSPSDHLGEL